MSVIQTIHLSVLEDSIPQTIPAVQNDTDRAVKMIIDDLTLTSGMTGTLNFKRSDGSHYGYSATLDTSDNSFTAPLDQALTQPGRTYCQLKVTDSDVVSTFTFIVNVTKDVSGTVTEQEGIDLVQAVEQAEDAVASAESAADRAESAASSLELDDTLSIQERAADAKAVGGAVADVKQAIITSATGTPFTLDLTVDDWTSGRIDHGYQETDSSAVYTTNRMERGDVTSVAFDDSKYWLVLGYWYADGSYKGNYGFATTSPVVPFGTITDDTVKFFTVGIKMANGTAINVNDVKSTTILTTVIPNGMGDDIADIKANGASTAKALASPKSIYASKESSFTPAYSGAHQTIDGPPLEKDHDYLTIITGDIADNNYVANIQMILNSSWTGTGGKNTFDSGIYYVLSPTVANCYPAFYVNSNAVGNLCSYNALVFDVTGMTITKNVVSNLYMLYTDHISSLELLDMIPNNIWSGKNVLVIGDSLTANGIWANQLNEVLDMNVSLHSKGGMPMVKLVDGENGIDGDYTDSSLLKPLSVADVTDKDLIIFYAGYNDRGKEDGVVGDVYNPADQSGNTIAGHLQYAINRTYQTLASANNLTCRIAVITPHCAGKYQYIDADGYQEFPAGSGRTMETMADIMVDVANYNSLPCLNLWKTSGINRNTWAVFAYSPTPTNSSGTGDYPYPYNNDQLHLNDAVGYPYLGKRVADWIKGL